MFMAALFVMAPKLKECECLLIGEWINIKHIIIVDYYSAMQSTELLIHTIAYESRHSYATERARQKSIKKFQEIQSNVECQEGDQWLHEWDECGINYTGRRKLSWVTDMFIVLIV